MTKYIRITSVSIVCLSNDKILQEAVYAFAFNPTFFKSRSLFFCANVIYIGFMSSKEIPSTQTLLYSTRKSWLYAFLLKIHFVCVITNKYHLFFLSVYLHFKLKNVPALTNRLIWISDKLMLCTDDTSKTY